MKRKEALILGVFVSLLAGAFGTACADNGGDGDAAGDGGDGGEGGEGGDAGDGDVAGDGDAAGDGDGDTGGDGDVEAPTSCAILADYVGKYTVSGPAMGEDHRGPSTADHERGTIQIKANYAIDFDTNISFDPTDITACYDRTTQDFDRRVHINYGADDDAEVINLYLNDALEVVEVQYRHNSEGVNVRVAVD